MTPQDLIWRCHPMDTCGHLASFTTEDLFVSIATTRWTGGYSIYWRMKDDQPHSGTYVTVPDHFEFREWLRDLGPVPAEMVAS